ncbi:hypothetical protein [Burkholderia lata]|uniref:hypothetical protein n=1 Tax=Burkholderia lata (strain ATCC 17760 / DSM 23089 / LMG 22485 / NCIMB 9086 / R18194 / 383) TaxID=482957 RepID=UPI0014546027|nr:hypothetical protein [Burkholderia lata]VWB88165.1 hypothetical protein BLA15816_04239 [Burkholderia lata]
MNSGDLQAIALTCACRTAPNRRVVVARIAGNTISWWGGSIEVWEPDETLLSSRVALTRYWQLVRDFRAGRLPVAHAIMVYRDGSFASVMLGVCTATAAAVYLTEAMELVRRRNGQTWLRA